MAPMRTMRVQRRKKNSMTWLPQDIVALILVRLPVSTLLWCRCVCKQWDGIIRDPQFTMAHIQSATRCPLLFFQRQHVLGQIYPSEAILFDEAWSPSRWNVPVIEPDDFLCASCNGLICLYSSKSTVKIANLATGECMHLAKPVKNSKDDHFSYYTLGFHPVTKQYKVMHFLRDNKLFVGSTFSIIQVYTLGDERWRDVRCPWALNMHCVERSGVVNIDGAMYWLAKDDGSIWKHAVVTFDLNVELFQWLQLPAVDLANNVLGDRDRWLVTEIDGKVSVATTSYSWLTGKLQIWTLDNKIEQSWSQKYNISLPFRHVPGPHFIYGDKIVMHDFDRNLYLYDLAGKNSEIELSKTVLNFSPRWDNSMQCFMFVKSLVRLDSYKKAGVVRRPKRREGWKLKKWEGWIDCLCRLENQCRRIHGLQHNLFECAHKMVMDINLLLQPLPDLQSNPLRQLNWAEHRRVLEILCANLDSMQNILMVMAQAVDATCNKEKIHVADEGTSSSAVDMSGP